MKLTTRKPSRIKLRKGQYKNLEWAKFVLVKHITYSLLALLWLFALVVLYLLVTGRISVSDAVNSLLIAGAIGGFGRLISYIYKSCLKPKD